MTKKTIQEIIESLVDNPYPDYNMGLLPDEEGYDNDKIERIYNHQAEIDQAVTQLEQMIVEARLDELKSLWNHTQPDIIPLGVEPDEVGKLIKKRIEALKTGEGRDE